MYRSSLAINYETFIKDLANEYRAKKKQLIDLDLI